MYRDIYNRISLLFWQQNKLGKSLCLLNIFLPILCYIIADGLYDSIELSYSITKAASIVCCSVGIIFSPFTL
jgi:hypothetical protein